MGRYKSTNPPPQGFQQPSMPQQQTYGSPQQQTYGNPQQQGGFPHSVFCPLQLVELYVKLFR